MFDWLTTDKTQLLVAGALGGLVRWITLRDKWTDGLASVVVGTICALYVSPLTIPIVTPALGGIGMPPESTNGLSGFLTGVAGIALSGILIDFWRLRKRQLEAEQLEKEELKK